MKRSLRTILIIAGALALAGALILGVSVLMGARPWNINMPSWVNVGFFSSDMSYKDWDNAYSADGSYSADADGISAVDLKWISGSVKVSVGGDKVAFSESGSPSEAQALRWGVEDGVLYIQCCPKGYSGNLPDKSLTLYLPERLAADLGSFSFDGSSADLSVSGLDAESFIFDSSSGKLSADGVSAGSVRLSSSSGGISFSGVYSSLRANSASGRVSVASLGSATKTEVNTASGDIRLSGGCGDLRLDTTSGRIYSEGSVSAESVTASATSGSISLAGSFGAVDVDTASGEVEISSDLCPASLYAETSSGGIVLTLPADSSFALRFDSASGSMDSELSLAIKGNLLICGDGSADFQVDTASGSLTIKQG